MSLLFFLLLLLTVAHSFSFSPPLSLSRLYHAKPSSIHFKYSGSLRKGKLSPPRKVPFGFSKPSYVKPARVASSSQGTKIYEEDPYLIPSLSSDEMSLMREGGRIARDILDTAVLSVKPGKDNASEISQRFNS